MEASTIYNPKHKQKHSSTSGEFSFNSKSRTSTEELTNFGCNELRDFKHKSMKNEIKKFW